MGSSPVSGVGEPAQGPGSGVGHEDVAVQATEAQRPPHPGTAGNGGQAPTGMDIVDEPGQHLYPCWLKRAGTLEVQQDRRLADGGVQVGPEAGPGLGVELPL